MQHQRYARRVPSRESDTSTGINVGIGSAVVVVAALVAAAVPASAGGLRVGLVAAGLAGFAAVTVDPRAAAFVTLLGFLVCNGFLVNRMGQLSWHGAPDLWRFGVLTVAAAAGLGLGAAHRRVADWRRFGPVEAWANGGPAEDPIPELKGSSAVPDLVYVLLTVVLFGLLVLAVRAVERL